MASRLPLRAHRSVPGFLLDAMRIRGQLAAAPGLVGYALDAQPARKTFWTFSVWEDEQSLSRFAAADPHRAAHQGAAAADGAEPVRVLPDLRAVMCRWTGTRCGGGWGPRKSSE